jgi:hypothetical protein
MAKKWKKRVLFAKIESVYGTDSAPAVTDAILTKNLKLDDPYAGDRVSRDLDLPTLGLQGEINVNPYATLSFDVEIAGSGTAGVAPRYGRLLRACGFTETIEAGSGPNYVDYDPNSDLDESCTLKFEGDGVQHVFKGARGNVEMTWQKGIPFYRFTISGLYTRPAAASVGTPNFSGIPVPLPVTKANTTIAVGSFTGPAASLTCNMGMQIFPRNVIGQEEILLTDRQPTGQIVIDQPDITVLNLFSDFVESHDGINTGAVSLVHGTAAGNIVTFSGPKAQLSTISEGEDNGLANYTLNARYIPDAGDDEVKLRVA